MSTSPRPVSIRVRNILCAALCCLVLALPACAPNIAPGHPVPRNPYAYQFEEYWYRFDRLYPYFDYKHVDWQAAYDHYRPMVDRVTSELQLVMLLKRMSTPLRDVHVWFRTPEGKYITTYLPKRAYDPNWSAAVRDKRVPDLAYFGGADWGSGHIDGFGYIFIDDWNKKALSLDDFSYMLWQFRHTPGLIVDVRMNAGGDETLPYNVAAHFARTPHLSEYFRYRNGPLPGDLGKPRATFLQPSLDRQYSGPIPLAKSLQPSPSWQYNGPVMLLIGPDSFSSTENFIAAMQTLPNVTTIGETTGGASGCPEPYALGNGWKYSVPICFDMTADHRVIEWNGIEPEVQVITTPEDFKHGDDPVLDMALKLLKAKSAAPPSGAGQPQNMRRRFSR
ncbi:MAG: S41 family peptidase [Gammaproteobacteria bacterium]